MYRINFYVPESHLKTVKDAMFSAGAGKIGHYSNCCWQTQGRGEFIPSSNSNPHLGKAGVKHTEPEYKVEMTCADDVLQQVLHALINSHPYEEPAYDAYKMITAHD
jgi:hypothetical protein